MDAQLAWPHISIHSRLDMDRPAAGGNLDRRAAATDKFRQPRPLVQPVHEGIEAQLHVQRDARRDVLDVAVVVGMQVDVVLRGRQRDVPKPVEPRTLG